MVMHRISHLHVGIGQLNKRQNKTTTIYQFEVRLLVKQLKNEISFYIQTATSTTETKANLSIAVAVGQRDCSPSTRASKKKKLQTHDRKSNSREVSIC